MDFTITRYNELLHALARAGYAFKTFLRFIEDEEEWKVVARDTGAGKPDSTGSAVPANLPEKAIAQFEKNLEQLRKLAQVKTACMFASPLSERDNRKLWEDYDYRDFGIVGEPYLDVDYSRILYLTDTGHPLAERTHLAEHQEHRQVSPGQVVKIDFYPTRDTG